MLPVNLRVTLIIALLCYFILILLFLKNKALELKYTLLWIFAGIFMGILIIFPDTLGFLIKILGIESNMNGLFLMCIAFLMMLVMALTSIVSKQSRKIKTLTQSIAILEGEVWKLRKKEEERAGQTAGKETGSAKAEG